MGITVLTHANSGTTTIGENISTDGNLTVGGNATTTGNQVISGKLRIGSTDLIEKLTIGGGILSDQVRLRTRAPQPLVTFVFDDGNLTEYTVMKPEFDAQGEVAVLAIYTDVIGDSGRLTRDHLTELENAGWEIASHSVSHPHLDTLSETEIETELKNSRDILESWGHTINNFVYPYHDQDSIVRRLTAKYYRSARGGIQGINPYPLPTYVLASLQADDYTQVATYKTWVDKAEDENKWIIFYLHTTDSDDVICINELIDYIQSKNISIVTMNQALDRIGNAINVSDYFAVSGTGRGIIIGNNDGTGTAGIINTPLLRISTSTTEALCVDSDGNVGIGTTTPSGKFHIIGGDFYHFGGASAGMLRMVSTGSSPGDYWFELYNSAGTGDGNKFYFTGSEGNPQVMTIDIANEIVSIDGNVGIGTTTPDGKLHIKGGRLYVEDDDIRYYKSGNALRISGSSGIWLQAGTDFTSGSSNDIIFSNMMGQSKYMVIKATSGNVGIGTSSPRSLLDIAHQTATTTITVGEAGIGSGKGACLKLRDTDDGAWTYCYVLDGSMLCGTASCE